MNWPPLTNHHTPVIALVSEGGEVILTPSYDGLRVVEVRAFIASDFGEYKAGQVLRDTWPSFAEAKRDLTRIILAEKKEKR